MSWLSKLKAGQIFESIKASRPQNIISLASPMYACYNFDHWSFLIKIYFQRRCPTLYLLVQLWTVRYSTLVCFCVSSSTGAIILKSDLIVRRRTAVHRFTFSNEKIDKSKSAVAIFFFSSSWLFSVSCFSCEEKNVLYLFNNWCYFWPVYFKVTRLKFVFLPFST